MATATIENRDTPAEPPGHAGTPRDWFVMDLMTGPNHGERYNPGAAMTYSAFWACVRVISQSIAALGWHVFQSEGRGKSRVYDDTAWVLDTQTSPEMSAFDFRQVILKDALVWGNGYAEIERDGYGRVRWLYRISPERVDVLRDERGAIYYAVDRYEGRDPIRLAPEQVYHLKGLGPDGLVGYSVVEMFRRTIGMALSIGRYGENFFQRGPMPGGVLKMRGMVDKVKRDEIREDINSVYGGSRNAGKVIVLFGDSEFEPLTMPNSDAQFLENQRFSVEEMARIFGVPPHKLADLTRSTNNNIEHQAIEFVQDCLLPWCRRLETEADIKLYGRRLRGQRWTRLNLQALLRGDSQTQVNNLQKLTTSGIVTVNEAREHLDYNPIDGGDTPLVQGAMVPLERVIEEPEPEPTLAPSPTQDDGDEPPQRPMPEDVQKTFRQLLACAYDRLLRVEADKAKRAYNKGLLSHHLSSYYATDAKAQTTEALTPIMSALLLAVGRSDQDTAARLAAEYATSHIQQSTGDLGKGVASIAGWGLEAGRPAMRAARQAEAHMAALWERLTEGDQS